jgi:hypothetical protein
MKTKQRTIVKPSFRTKKKTTYSNSDGLYKDIARWKIVDSIKDGNLKNRRILSLPADNCIIEGYLFEKVSKLIQFVLCEKNEQVYKKLLMNIINSKTRIPHTILSGSIGDEIYRSKENDYTDLILDYCGQIGTYHKEIEHAIKNNIVCVDGTISITLNKRISGGRVSGGGKNMEFIKKMEELNPNFDKKEGDNRTEPAVMTFLNRVCGMNYQIVEKYSYRDDGEDKRRSPMILVIIRRVS